MARSMKGGRKKRQRLDWVSNPRTYAPWTDAYGIVVADGVVTLPLTICDKVRILQTGLSNSPNEELMSWTAIPEGNRGSVRAVRGQIQVNVQTTFSAGDRLALAMRLCIHEQDPVTLAAITDPNYALGVNTSGGIDAHSQANERFLWERKVIRAQSAQLSNPGEFIMDINWSGRRTLRPDSALFLAMELGDSSTAIFFSTWLRTLMVVGE